MLLNKTTQISTYIIYVTVINLLGYGISINAHSSLCPDFFLRSLSAENWFTGSYLLWTNFFDLYCLLLFSTLILCIYSIRPPHPTLNITFLLIFVLFWSLFSITSGSKLLPQWFRIDTLPSDWNILLDNPLNKIHPMFFFSVFILSLLSPSTSRMSSSLKRDLISRYILAIILLVSILLGSWWAYQEGSWGGWWDWDASELMSLFVFYHVLLPTHKLNNFSSYGNFKLVLFRSSLTLVSTFIILQVSLSVISHNFGTSTQSSFIFVNYLLLLIQLVHVATLPRVFNDHSCRIQLRSILLKTHLIQTWPTRLDFSNILRLYIMLVSWFVIYLSYSLLFSEFIANIISLILSRLPSLKFNFLVLVAFIIMCVFVIMRFNLFTTTSVFFFNLTGHTVCYTGLLLLYLWTNSLLNLITIYKRVTLPVLANHSLILSFAGASTFLLFKLFSPKYPEVFDSVGLGIFKVLVDSSLLSYSLLGSDNLTQSSFYNRVHDLITDSAKLSTITNSFNMNLTSQKSTSAGTKLLLYSPAFECSSWLIFILYFSFLALTSVLVGRHLTIRIRF